MSSRTVVDFRPGSRTGAASNGSGAPVVVIGAGPYGLSVAAHLRSRGIEARVFGEPMSTWTRCMPAGMFLKSTPAASSIAAPVAGYTLRDFCHDAGTAPLDERQAVPIELFERYGLWFQERLVPWVEPVQVRRVSSAGGAYDITLSSGEQLRSRSVVIATGVARFAHVPGQLALDGAVSHSSQHRDLSVFTGRRVAVIGGGQSGLETAALLQESGARVHVLVRGNQVLYAEAPSASRHFNQVAKPASPMGPGWSLFGLHRGASIFRYLPDRARLRTVRVVLGPSGAWWLRERVEGEIDVRTRHQVRAVSRERRGVVLHLNEADRRAYELPVDHVIAATGYRVDLGALGFLTPALIDRIARVGGSPRLTAGFESSEPGLFFAGLAAAATFGPLLRFVCGTSFCAPRVSAAVAVATRSRIMD